MRSTLFKTKFLKKRFESEMGRVSKSELHKEKHASSNEQKFEIENIDVHFIRSESRPLTV